MAIRNSEVCNGATAYLSRSSERANKIFFKYTKTLVILAYISNGVADSSRMENKGAISCFYILGCETIVQ